jgi:hypothetical protein
MQRSRDRSRSRAGGSPVTPQKEIITRDGSYIATRDGSLVIARQ